MSEASGASVSKPHTVLGMQWASPGHAVNGFCKRHMVCESIHLPPEMWSQRLILRNASGNAAAPWPLRGSEGCLRTASGGPSQGQPQEESSTPAHEGTHVGVQYAGSQAGFLGLLQHGPGHPRPELTPPSLAEFQQACQITCHGGDWICAPVGPNTRHDHTGLHRQLNGPAQKQCKVLRVTECALPKTDTGLFAVPGNKRPRDCRQGTFSWSLSTPQLDKTTSKQGYGHTSPLGPLLGQLTRPNPSCPPAADSGPPTCLSPTEKPEGLKHGGSHSPRRMHPPSHGFLLLSHGGLGKGPILMESSRWRVL